MKRRRDAPRTRINRGVKKGRMIVLKVLKENLVVSRRTKLGERNQLSKGGSEWRKVL